MNQSVLVVDDSRSVRSMVSHTLREAGYSTTEAIDGVTGLESARDGVFDLVITDINMPNMDGFELIRHLRSEQNYQYAPILVLTTESDNEMKQMGRAAGATGWILKPFDPEKLLGALRRVLG